MDFITWWFDSHCILSTLLTPFWSFIWCCFKENYSWRFFVSLIVGVLQLIGEINVRS